MFLKNWKGLLKKCKILSGLPVLENFRAKHHNAQHLGQIPKAVTGAACPTLAQPQLTEMDSPEWNEAHKAPCTPRQRLYQTKINGRQHSLWAPKQQWQIQYLGGLWESLIGLGCVCVRLASFNQVSQQQTLGVKWCVSGSEAFQAGQKVGEAVGLRARALSSAECLSVFQWSSKGLCPSSCKIGRQGASKIPYNCESTQNCSIYSEGANQASAQPASDSVRNWKHIFHTFIKTGIAITCLHMCNVLCFHNS